MRSRLERDIQEAVTKAATELELLPIRINVVGRKGWPDYGYVYSGRILFIEFKRPGERPEPLQDYVHKTLRKVGATVFVIDHEDYGVTLIKEWKREVDRELERLRQSGGRG